MRGSLDALKKNSCRKMCINKWLNSKTFFSVYVNSHFLELNFIWMNHSDDELINLSEESIADSAVLVLGTRSNKLIYH